MIHQGQPVLRAGEPLEEAGAAMVLAHGRGATARDILTLTEEFRQPGFAYLAPQAAGNSWWPLRFMDPIASNEPALSSALRVMADLLIRLSGAGIPAERTMLLGFSQGACLVLEYAARNARRYGAVAGLSGGLVGPDGTPRDYAGSLLETPVFLGCSDTDLHIPKARVLQTADVLKKLGAQVTTRLYPNMDHTINADEVEFVRVMMGKLTGAET
jgi:phospholipase/carboxylesterase